MGKSAMAAGDPYNLQRFVDAQDAIYGQVRSELSSGRKTSHWMWFIFPQIAGLGSSPMANRYAVQPLAEARAYLHHPVLGDRLLECSDILAGHGAKPIDEILPWPDDLKLKSSMTLFSRATDQNQSFLTVLNLFFDGELDPLTLDLLTIR